MMNAVTYRKGTGLKYEQVPRPVPDPDQVLVEVSNVGFCGSDHTMVVHDYLPDGHILGHEVSGVITEVGSQVKGHAPGDRVTIRPNFCGKCPDCLAGRTPLCAVDRKSIGTGGPWQGGFAEYLPAYADMLISIPAGTDSQNAALAEVFATALHAIRSSGVKGGSALVLGGGPIGLSVVQVLTLLAFDSVVLSEPVPFKREIGSAFGADVAINPFEEDLKEFTRRFTEQRGFDVVFECSGVPTNIQTGIDCATAGGTVSILSIMADNVTINPLSMNCYREIRLVGSFSSTQEENRQCLQWMASGQLDGRRMISDVITLKELPEIFETRIHTGKALKVMLQVGSEF